MAVHFLFIYFLSVQPHHRMQVVIILGGWIALLLKARGLSLALPVLLKTAAGLYAAPKEHGLAA